LLRSQMNFAFGAIPEQTDGADLDAALLATARLDGAVTAEALAEYARRYV
jgi:hypothetical protein